MTEVSLPNPVRELTVISSLHFKRSISFVIITQLNHVTDFRFLTMGNACKIEVHAYAGWQPRWFVLNDGVLSYYKSLEEVGQGCKGSINVASCEIQLHSTDTNRLDLSIPGEQVTKFPDIAGREIRRLFLQHIYVRAATEKERQKWLIALGSSKACLQQNSSGTLVKRSTSPLTSNGIQVFGIGTRTWIWDFHFLITISYSIQCENEKTSAPPSVPARFGAK